MPVRKAAHYWLEVQLPWLLFQRKHAPRKRRLRAGVATILMLPKMEQVVFAVGKRFVFDGKGIPPPAEDDRRKQCVQVKRHIKVPHDLRLLRF